MLYEFEAGFFFKKLPKESAYKNNNTTKITDYNCVNIIGRHFLVRQ